MTREGRISALPSSTAVSLLSERIAVPYTGPSWFQFSGSNPAQTCRAVSRQRFPSPCTMQNYGITEYPELEGTHKDHRVQLLAPYRTTYKLNHMSESVMTESREQPDKHHIQNTQHWDIWVARKKFLYFCCVFFFLCSLFPIASITFSSPQHGSSLIALTIPFLYLSSLHHSFSFTFHCADPCP